MKIKDGFILAQVGENSVAVPTAKAAEAFHGMIRMNGTAAFIVKQLQQETTREALIDAMEQEYEGTREQFAAGVDKILAQLRRCGALEE